ncbi:OmpA family protein [Pseudoxanthomonas beigongshangi]|uniref:OmpA family protein n=1 Tax=Pseudoxanthomonas beigongshangi TaxID=2782537 RepID=UPI00193B6319|nr:OmpA family protein [Pseudoxanthomonas beigongshangi]
MNRNLGRAGLLVLLLSLPAGALLAGDNPVVIQLGQRLAALRANPEYAELAAFERLQAQQAISELAEARRSVRERAQYVAERRVEIAEIATRTQAAQREVGRLDRTRSELLVEASRREAERARQEVERMRIQAQIQAEEAERLRQAAEAETLARQDAELALTSVAGQQSAKLSAARQKEARLAREEAELVSGTKLPASKFEARGEVFTLPASAFAGGSAKLSEAGQSSASALAAYLQASPKAKARIEGFGDKQTPGQRRADALRDALVAAGVSKGRIQAAGKGNGSSSKAAEIVVTQ